MGATIGGDAFVSVEERSCKSLLTDLAHSREEQDIAHSREEQDTRGAIF